MLLAALLVGGLSAGAPRLMAQDYEDYDEAGDYQPEMPLDMESAANAWQEALNLYDQGQFGTASELARLAATHFENLSRDDPERFRPSQFSCLLLEVGSLRRAGEIESSLSKGLTLAEKLKGPVQAAPSVYLPILAELNQELAESNYAFQRSSGREERVLGYRRAAVEAYQILAREKPDEFLPILEDELSTLILDCREFGRDQERLLSIERLLEVSRLQARGNQDGKKADLARNLAAYGEELALMGRKEAGLAALREALDLFRELEKNEPGAYAVDLSNAEFVLQEQLQ